MFSDEGCSFVTGMFNV